MGLIEDIGSRLVSAGIGTLGTDLFYAFVPNQPDLAIALFQYAGPPPEDVFGQSAPAVDTPRLHVRVRAGERDYPSAHAKAQAVWQELHTIANEDINGTRYFRVSKLSGPFTVMVDENDRPLLAMNFQVWMVP